MLMIENFLKRERREEEEGKEVLSLKKMSY